MQLVEVFLLITLVVRWKMPLALVPRAGVDSERAESGMVVGILHADGVECTGEGILIGGAGVVGDLELALVESRVMVDVDVTALDKSVVLRCRGWVGQAVVYVCEAGNRC